MTAPVAHPLLLAVLKSVEPPDLSSRVVTSEEWDTIIGDADAHGLTSLLWDWLCRTERRDRVPPAIVARLEGEVFRLAARGLLLADELRRILASFANHGVACAPLRGPALAELVHGVGITRPTGDLDLLVRREQLELAATILRDLGFAEMDRRPGFARDFSYTLEFYKDRFGFVVVEPHWSIVYPPFLGELDMEEVWRRCRRSATLGTEVLTLGREDLLLHLCLHVAHRGATAPLLWWFEIACLAREKDPPVDWSLFQALAVAAKVSPLLARVASEVNGIFGEAIPTSVVDALERVPTPRRHLVRLLEAPTVDGTESLAALWAIGNTRRRLRYASAILFPSATFMMLHYGLAHRRELARAYLRRVCRLSWEGVKGLRALANRTP